VGRRETQPLGSGVLPPSRGDPETEAHELELERAAAKQISFNANIGDGGFRERFRSDGNTSVAVSYRQE
jgi:hypothetical protein